MRRLAVAALVLLVVLTLGGAVVDRLLVARTEDRLLATLEEHAELDPSAEVTVDGFPFLTQVLAGRLAEVRGRSAAVTIDGVELRDVRVAARGVSPQEPHAAETVEANALVPVATLQAVIDDAADLPGDGARVSVENGLLRLGVEVAGLELAVGLDPVVVDEAVGLRLGEVAVGGAEAPQEVVGFLDDLLGDVRLEIPALPDGLAPTRLAVVEQGLQVRLEGRDVALAEAGG